MHPFFEDYNFFGFVHRGGDEEKTENTLEAFQYSSDLGFVFMETDVQSTLDGKVVIFHDETLERVAGINKKVSQLTFQEIKKIDLINDFYLELENIIMNIQSLAEKINADLKIIELAKQEQSVASSLIENGMISQIEMENAELNILESELLLLQSKLQYQISLAALYRLIGGKEILYEN